MERMNFVHTNETAEKGSTFQGHAIRMKNAKDFKIGYCKVRALYPDSDHVMMAYVVKGYTGHCDHGEFGAGKRLLNILQSQNYSDVAVFMTREYGGIQFGQCRFMYIERVAQEALDMLTAVP